MGWPMAIAPPLTLTFAVSQPRSLFTAQAWAAKASLASIRSRSPMFQPAFFNAAREAGMGPVPMIAGSTPACAQETIRAMGFLPRLAASLAFISTTAAAPSLIPEALPAWLELAHRKLDAAVFDAYGWPHDLSDDEILARLLGLNLERAAGPVKAAVGVE